MKVDIDPADVEAPKTDPVGAKLVDKDELEVLFEVEAPSGMLGLVMKSSTDGVPTVQAIESSSPLVTQVRVGDQLLSVDEQDLRGMLSSEVTKVIASKKDNPVRKFVFFTRPYYDTDNRFDVSESSHKDELEVTFEVEAPSGVLGLVMKSSTDGVPTVQAIESSSPLVTQVRVGDQLLSVDGK